MSGTYKGFVYCDSLDEAKEILYIVQPIVDETIYKGIPILVKRGCSEFSLAYPAYGPITDNKTQQVTYNEEWRKHEAYVDNNLAKPAEENPNDFTFNHSGFTLHDALVMRNWLTDAETIGDSTYLDIFEPTLPKPGPHSWCLCYIDLPLNLDIFIMSVGYLYRAQSNLFRKHLEL